MFLITTAAVAQTTDDQAIVDSIASNNQKILRGWNTWNNPSLLSHVRMPDGLNLQVVFRKKRTGPYWLDDAYVASPQYNFAEVIEPQQHSYDGSYTELHIRWEGLSATVQSARDGDDLMLVYTPDQAHDADHSLVLKTGFLWNKPGTVQLQDDHLTAETRDTITVIRSIGRQTQRLLPLNSPYLTFESSDQVAIYTGPERSLGEVLSIVDRQRSSHMQRAQRFGALAPTYEAFQSVVAWNLFYDAPEDRGISSVSRIWNEAWGASIIFDWDTYFIATLAAVDYKELAYNNILAITGSITDGGFIPNVASTFAKSSDRSQPPVGSMTVKHVYDIYGEKWLLEAVYDHLLSWNRWWPRARDNQGFLSWGSTPHPEGMKPNTLEAAKWESGLDNSPLFDEAVFNEETHMMELASVGLMGLYIADCKYLAAIAEELDKKSDAKELRKRAKQYGNKLDELWDEATGIYRDKNLATGEFSTHLAPTNFYPLLAKVPNQQRAERMIKEHLMNPEEFYGDYMMPSIARNDPAFGDNSYWRGRIWAPMNYLVYLGLRNYDLREAQELLAEKSKELIMTEWKGKRHVHENYNSVTGEGDDVRNSDPFYAWGGLLGYIPLIEAGHIPLQPLKE